MRLRQSLLTGLVLTAMGGGAAYLVRVGEERFAEAGLHKGGVRQVVHKAPSHRGALPAYLAQPSEKGENLNPFSERIVTRNDVKAFLKECGTSEANLFVARQVFGVGDSAPQPQELAESAFAREVSREEIQRNAAAEAARYRALDPGNAYADLLEIRTLAFLSPDSTPLTEEVFQRITDASRKPRCYSESTAREAAVVDFWKSYEGEAREGWIAAMEEGYGLSLSDSSPDPYAPADDHLLGVLSMGLQRSIGTRGQPETVRNVLQFAKLIGEGDSVRRNGGLGMRIEQNVIRTLMAAGQSHVATDASHSVPVEEALRQLTDKQIHRPALDKAFIPVLRMASPQQIEEMEAIYQKDGILMAQQSLALKVGVCFPWSPDPFRPSASPATDLPSGGLMPLPSR